METHHNGRGGSIWESFECDELVTRLLFIKLISVNYKGCSVVNYLETLMLCLSLYVYKCSITVL